MSSKNIQLGAGGRGEGAGGELSNLAERALRASRPAGHASGDDSGIIDLRALMRAAREADRRAGEEEAARADATPLAVVRPLDIYPFGAPEEKGSARPASPPAPPPSRVASPPAPPPSRVARWSAGLWMLLGAGLLGLAVVVPVLVQTLPDDEAVVTVTAAGGPVHGPAAAQVALWPILAESPNAAVPVAIADTSLPAASSEVDPDTVVAPSSAAPVGEASAPARLTPVRSSPRATTSATAEKPRPAAPPVDPCNGDLLCAMKRATQGT